MKQLLFVWKKKLIQTIWFVGDRGFLFSLVAISFGILIAGALFFFVASSSFERGKDAKQQETEFRKDLFDSILTTIEVKKQQEESVNSVAKDIFNP